MDSAPKMAFTIPPGTVAEATRGPWYFWLWPREAGNTAPIEVIADDFWAAWWCFEEARLRGSYSAICFWEAGAGPDSRLAGLYAGRLKVLDPAHSLFWSSTRAFGRISGAISHAG